MDDEQPHTGSSGSLSVVRAVAVLILFVVAVAVLVSVGTRPSVSSTPTTTTPTTTAPAGGSTTTTSTAAAAGAATSSTTTTTAAHHTTTTKAGHKGSTKGATTTTTAPHSATTVVVANATTAHYSTVIGAGGWTMQTPLDASTSEATSAVYYAPGQQEQAASIATTIGVKPAQVLPISAATPLSSTTGIDVAVVIGSDLAASATTTTAA
jgi:hypothetical protein